MASKIADPRTFFSQTMSYLIDQSSKHQQVRNKLETLQDETNKIFKRNLEPAELERKVCRKIIKAVRLIAREDDLDRTKILDDLANKITERDKLKSKILVEAIKCYKATNEIFDAQESAKTIPSTRIKERTLIELIDIYLANNLVENREDSFQISLDIDLGSNPSETVLDLIEKLEDKEIKAKKLHTFVRTIIIQNEDTKGGELKRIICLAEKAILQLNKAGSRDYYKELCRDMIEFLQQKKELEKAQFFENLLSEAKPKSRS